MSGDVTNYRFIYVASFQAAGAQKVSYHNSIEAFRVGLSQSDLLLALRIIIHNGDYRRRNGVSYVHGAIVCIRSVCCLLEGIVTLAE